MAKYIDADKLKNNLLQSGAICDFGLFLIEKQPAVDVQKVKHGEWRQEYCSGREINEGFVSSCCDMWNERKTDYCPNCGAKMDGKDNK